MSSNKVDYKKMAEKLKYFYTMNLREKKCDVKSIDIDFDLHTFNEITLIEVVNIYMDLEFDGYLDSDDPSSFAYDLQRFLTVVRDCLTEYTPTKEGKIVKGDEEAYVSDPMIFELHYKYDEVQKFSLSFKIHFPD
jgi:hypothetical protein